jgi:tRNA uridine 5-carboxymethylaminomethyl modification enzyme
VHIGLKNEQSGPIYDVVHQDKIETLYSTFSSKLSNNLKSIGFEIIRLKTGTPPRIFIDSIDFSKMEKQPGSKAKIAFSHFAPTYVPFKKQQLCYLTYTNEKTHKIIRANLNQSAMYAGMIKGSGPRYCPSIEDKVVRFSDKPRHQLFIEPESLALPTMYIQGLSTSLSTSVQDQVVHSIKGLEKAKFQRYGYAIEYDAINPIQLYKTLESKLIKHLFFAGQVNGTSGYEEAAGQGMLAGLNVSLMAKHKKPIILKRNEAYIGVMVDDIVTKGITDPYRLLTSRAEFRLTLRNDNADERLIKYGYQAGIIRLSDYQQFNLHLKLRQKVIKYLSTHSLTSTLLKKYGNSAHTLYALLKRPNINLKMLLPQKLYVKLSNDDINKIEINVKFDGYIKNEIKNHNRYLKLQNIDLTKIKDYKKIKNLSLEAIDKLNRIKPHDLAQAQKIQGITMTDIIMIKYYLDQNE